MKQFMDKDFLLQSEVARELFHGYAEKQPIIDYHCHLSAKEICENKPAKNLTELWLYGDHYKWRGMRSNGIPENRITGPDDDYDRFLAYAETMPFAIGNPLYHWSHLELQRYFGIDDVISPKNAPAIWEKTTAMLADGTYTPQRFIEQSNVYALCTTEDPADTLEYHFKIRQDNILSTKVVPAFRPDKALQIEKDSWKVYTESLAKAAGVKIDSYASLKLALLTRMEEFAKAGCPASDHGFDVFPFRPADDAWVESTVAKALAGDALSDDEIEGFKTNLMLWLGRQYAARGWVMEIHFNAMRCLNTAAFNKLGPDTGFDSVGEDMPIRRINAFLNELEKTGELPKTVLFSLSDVDNIAVATTLGNFQDSTVPSKIQMGTAWWFQDNLDGMEKQMRCLANEGILGRFIGMLTDSRSFLSYPRHEYFRRILCNLIGNWVEDGLYPYDMETLGMLVERICFTNAKEYFGL